MFEFLEDYPSVVVTGSGRSGTHVCADMIASDLGYRYTPETDFSQNDWNRFMGWMTRGHVVCQAPDLWASMHEVPEEYAVVIVKRSEADIMASWNRAGYMPKDPPSMVYIALDKLRSRANVYCTEYERLSAHPLWVPVEVRRSRTWGWAQTRLPQDSAA